ncbi:MAG: SPOR domain-containing protein [Gallionellaceae bacterium]|jgi:hypothetical protein|nr:SPOR domain-containing protein [Gallionellaceae bacterium]
MKWLFTLLALACAGFFAYMEWGGTEAVNPGLQPQPPLNADKITLLPAVEPETPPSADTPAVLEALALCMEWGEIAPADVARASAALAALQPGDALSQRQVAHVDSYWVYLEPAKTATEAKTKVEQLKTLGVKDYFLIQNDDQWNNAVSLGIFKTQQAAEDYRDALTAKGVQSAQVGERTGKRKSTVFVLKNPDSALLEKVSVLSREYPGTEIKSAACGE